MQYSRIFTKCSEFNLHLAKDKEKLLLKLYNEMYSCSTSCMCIKCIVFELLDCELNKIIRFHARNCVIIIKRLDKQLNILN